MKITKSQWLFVLALAAVNAVLWIVPSNVVELVARDRQTLLGRYSREHFAWIMALLPISAAAIYIHLSASRAIKKSRSFRIAAVLLVLVPTVAAADIYLRLTTEYNYVLDGLAYRRPSGVSLQGEYQDLPEAIRSYPNAPPGFGQVPWELTVDGRGFRNLTDADQYDVVVLGDSFAEGSRVTDERPWPVQFGRMSGMSVYNLGMSGYAPQHYLAALRQHGLALEPRYVMCMIYEGNDFKSAKRITEAPSEWKRFFKRSPIVATIDEFLIKTLGPIGAERRIDCLDMLSWLPVAVPSGPETTHYAFSPSALARHCVTSEQFAQGKRWRNTVNNLEQIKNLCAEAGAELIVVFAPTAPHVVLPLAKEALPAEKVRAFVALKSKRDLPGPDAFMTRFLDSLEAKESVLSKWCGDAGAGFVSLTNPMRQAIARGQQTYFTYNQHWSPVGHDVAARAIHNFWTTRQAGEPS